MFIESLRKSKTTHKTHMHDSKHQYGFPVLNTIHFSYKIDIFFSLFFLKRLVQPHAVTMYNRLRFVLSR